MSAQPTFRPGKSPPSHAQLYQQALRGQPAHKLSVPKHKPPKAYLAEGGPYDGEVLALQDGNTAVLSFRRGKYGAIKRGRYLVGLASTRAAHNVHLPTVQRRFKEGGRAAVLHNINIGTTVWSPL